MAATIGDNPFHSMVVGKMAMKVNSNGTTPSITLPAKFSKAISRAAHLIHTSVVNLDK